MRAGAAALVAALALAGCGEDRGASVSTQTDPPPPRPATPAPAEAPPAATVDVAESEYRLDPARIRVDRPATLAIEIRNSGATRHALAIEGSGVEAATPPLEPGTKRTLEVELRKAGRYRWYCPVDGHAKKGMRGTIQVARGD